MPYRYLSVLLLACPVGCANDAQSVDPQGTTSGTNPSTSTGQVESGSSTATEPDGTSSTGVESSSSSSTEGDTDEADVDSEVAFELLQFVSQNELIVWISAAPSVEEFDALDVPMGWIKNQPREGEPDQSRFLRSPDASMDGVFTEAEHFGHPWLHNATVVEINTPGDDEGLLSLNRVAKFHEVGFDAGRTLWILVSPEGTPYVRISRDLNRTSEMPTVPEGWLLEPYRLSEPLTVMLPNPTVNFRGDNEDSFQGPVDVLAGVVGR